MWTSKVFQSLGEAVDYLNKELNQVQAEKAKLASYQGALGAIWVLVFFDNQLI